LQTAANARGSLAPHIDAQSESGCSARLFLAAAPAAPDEPDALKWTYFVGERGAADFAAKGGK